MKKTIIQSTAILALAVSIIIAAQITKPVCNRPYIQVGRDCCLDENNDRICDTDKPVTTTIKTTTSTTASTTTTSRTIETSSTTIQSTATSVTTIQTTIKTTTTTTIESTTTTVGRYDFSSILNRIARQLSTSTTTTTTLPKCTDSDGGIKYDTKSTSVSGYFAYNDTTLTGIQEYCVDKKDLLEYYCESGILKSRRYTCPEHCVNGRCCKGESTACTGDKECCSGTCRAIGMTKYCVEPWT